MTKHLSNLKMAASALPRLRRRGLATAVAVVSLLGLSCAARAQDAASGTGGVTGDQIKMTREREGSGQPREFTIKRSTT